MASCALQRSLGRCSLMLRQSYASLAAPCSPDGAWAGQYYPESGPACNHNNQSHVTTPPRSFSLDHLAAWQAQLPSPADLLGRLSSILPQTWVEGLADGLVLTSHQTYKPKVLKRKRSHGFLARLSTPGGRRTLKRRKDKKRRYLTV